MSKPKPRSPAVVQTATVKIHAPVSRFSGESAGVQFRDGVGETDNPWLIQWFKDHGYTVEGQLAETPADEAPADDAAEKGKEEKGDE